MNIGRKFNYLIISLSILLTLASCDKEVFTGIPDPAPSKYYQIYIQSKPNSASIYLNSKNMGIKTPDSLKWIPEGNQLITLKLPLYQDTTITLNLTGGGTKNLFVDFSMNSKNVGNLNLGSDPVGAELWLNDTHLDKKTPCVISRLVPGDYKVKLTSPLHRADSTNITVPSFKTTDLFITLEDTSKWVSYNTRNSPMVSDYIFSLACDKNNVEWIGTANGLMSLSGKKWNLYKTSNSILQSDFISCIGVDSSNKKWIGTSAGLFTYDGTTWQDYSSNLPDPHVTAILFDKAGSVWIGTYGGLVKFSTSTWSVYNINNSGLKENLVTCLTEDNTGKIWMGTPHNYINIFDGKNWKYYDNTNINSRINGVGKDALLIQAMAMDSKGIIWVSMVGPTGGAIVLTFDGSTWNIITGMSYFGGSYPLAMYSKGDFLIFGNYNGLSVQNNIKNSFSYFKTANSALQLFRLQAVTMDNQNNIWVGSFFYGIGKFKNGNF